MSVISSQTNQMWFRFILFLRWIWIATKNKPMRTANRPSHIFKIATCTFAYKRLKLKKLFYFFMKTYNIDAILRFHLLLDHITDAYHTNLHISNTILRQHYLIRKHNDVPYLNLYIFHVEKIFLKFLEKLFRKSQRKEFI